MVGFCAKRLKTFRTKLKVLLKRCRGSNVKWFIEKKLNAVLRDWFNYYRVVDWDSPFKILDGWIRHRLRVIFWRQWKRPRTRIRKLVALGLKKSSALKVVLKGNGPWRSSMHSQVNLTLNLSYFQKLGLLSLHQRWKEYRTVK